MLYAPADQPQQSLVKLVRVVFALALAVVALANVVTLLAPKPWQPAVRLEHVVDLDALANGREGGLALALLLLLVGRALMRGKRHAWLIAVGLLIFSSVSAVVSRAYMGYTALLILLLVTMIALAPLFSARSDPRALKRGYIALGVCIACYLGHGLILTISHRDVLDGAARLPLPVRNLLLHGLRSALFLSLGYGVVEVLRPVLRARQIHRDEHRKVEALVQRHGVTTMAHFALGPDLSYFWSADERAVLAYRLAAGVALILGDPIGPEEAIAPLLLAFLAYTRRQDWGFAIYLASPRIQRICRAWGQASYKVGEEALVTVADFSTVGKAGAPVRHAISRAKRDGVTVRCWQREAPPEDVFAGMKLISRSWLDAHGTSMQMGFSMGRFPADWSPELLTSVALNAQGEVIAFLTWTPLHQANGWSLDNMRRTAQTTPGAMEMLIAESLEWARARGCAQMSLGLAPLAGLGASVAADPSGPVGGEPQTLRPSALERGAAFLYERKLVLGSYASLHAFKSKFHPVWEPRYLVLADVSALPKTLVALMRAHGYTWWRVAKDSGLPGMLSPHRLIGRADDPASQGSDASGQPSSAAPAPQAALTPIPGEP